MTPDVAGGHATCKPDVRTARSAATVCLALLVLLLLCGQACNFRGPPLPGVPRSTACHGPHHSSHSLTRRHGNVPRAGKHVRRVYRIWEGIGARLGPCVVAAQKHYFWSSPASPVAGGLAKRRRRPRQLEKASSRVWQTSRHCNRRAPNLCTRRAKSHRSGQGPANKKDAHPT
jgi:hypothetical protein